MVYIQWQLVRLSHSLDPSFIRVFHWMWSSVSWHKIWNNHLPNCNIIATFGRIYICKRAVNIWSVAWCKIEKKIEGLPSKTWHDGEEGEGVEREAAGGGEGGGGTEEAAGGAGEGGGTGEAAGGWGAGKGAGGGRGTEEKQKEKEEQEKQQKEEEEKEQQEETEQEEKQQQEEQQELEEEEVEPCSWIMARHFSPFQMKC